MITGPSCNCVLAEDWWATNGQTSGGGYERHYTAKHGALIKLDFVHLQLQLNFLR
jgi:hypothetical protein